MAIGQGGGDEVVVHGRHTTDGGAVRAVNGGYVGDEGIADLREGAREGVHEADVSPLAGPVQGDLFPMFFLEHGAELAGLGAIVVRRHVLHDVVLGDILDHPHVGGDAFVGEAVGVALALVGKEREDMLAEHIGGYQEHGFQVVPYFYAFLDRQHLIHEEGTRVMDQPVRRGVEMKPEVVFDFFDLFREVGDRFHDLRFALEIARQVFPLVIEEGVEECLVGFLQLVD